ncbi:MAG TPA: methyltransferase domain-containing protein [Micromonosporaceae bacterium]|nr:methyltransferase domain-containing protein [Micromonosporaceae bacterium]
MNPRFFYDIGYRFFRMPWETGPRAELVELVEAGRLRPGRAVDLGCGTGANAVYLARHGFAVTGVDFAASALAKARAAAERAGVALNLHRVDLTDTGADLRARLGEFDLLVDYGTMDDLSPAKRDRYLRAVLPLARPGAEFLLWCFEWPPRRWDRWTMNPMAPGEVDRRFGGHFEVERIAATDRPDLRRAMPGFAAYLMTRREVAA